MLFYQILPYNVHIKIQSHIETKKNVKYQLLHGMKNLHYLKVYILYQIFKILSKSSKKKKTLADNPPIRIYINKNENRISFKTKTGYYLKQ